jgi:hypothetical protein
VKITDDTVTISLKNASVVDQFTFPGGAGGNLGIAGVPATISFDITYSKSVARRHVEPTTTDPLSPFNWEGEMWDATNSGTFKLSYNDGSFSAQGSFDSAGNFGEIGFERNGSFAEEDARHEEGHDAHVLGAKPSSMPAPTHPEQNQPNVALALNAQGAQQPPNEPKFRGKIPVRELIH